MKQLLEINKSFRKPRFAPGTLKKAFEVFKRGTPPVEGTTETLTLTKDDVRYPRELVDLDDFLSERRPGELYQWSRSDYVKNVGDYRLFLSWSDSFGYVTAASESEAHLRDVIGVLDEAEKAGPSTQQQKLESRSLNIFIGHGQIPRGGN